MNIIAWLTANPFLARLLVFLVSLAVGWLINWAIITQAYSPRAIGAWNPAPVKLPRRTWLDWIPVLGWYRMQRESTVHGKLFWLRPFLIELIFPLAMVWMYDAETTGKMLPSIRLAASLQAELHSHFLGHFVLIALMSVATFIDFDEQLIPDTITIPGALLGMLGSVLLAAWFPFLPFVAGLEELHAASIGAWPPSLSGIWGLVLGLVIVTIWCFGLLDRVWITRRGWSKALRYFCAAMFRSRWWIIVAGVWLATMIGVTLGWIYLPGRWPYLLSSLIGLAVAGGITWAVRIGARMALQVEALGFGDVTLMAMIGTYLGWQPSLLVFFVAPMIAVLVFAARYLLTGDGSGPYGPYLCLAAAFVTVFWESFRTGFAAPILELPAAVIMLILFCAVVMLSVMLSAWRFIRGRIHGLGRS